MSVNKLDELKSLARLAEHVGLKPALPRPAAPAPEDRLDGTGSAPRAAVLKVPPPPARGV
jgi:hypothetical protein